MSWPTTKGKPGRKSYYVSPEDCLRRSQQLKQIWADKQAKRKAYAEKHPDYNPGGSEARAEWRGHNV